MLRAILALASFAAARAAPSPSMQPEDFSAWAQLHGKTYASAQETSHRAQVYAANVEFIRSHNAAAGHSYLLGMNQFGDMTQTEWAAFINSQLPRRNSTAAAAARTLRAPAPPTSVDWQAAGAVGPVENQGQLGDVWAFVYANVVASWQAVTTKSPYRALSPQQLGECTDQFGVQAYILEHGLCGGDYPSGNGCSDTKCQVRRLRRECYIGRLLLMG